MMLPLTLGVCLQLAATPQTPPQFIPVTTFTLAWQHTIEKVRWEEDYRVLYDSTTEQAILQAVSARIKGSAAGMEPPEQSRLQNGWYHYSPIDQTPSQLHLMRSEFSPDYDWCDVTGCVLLAEKILSDGGVTLLTPCTQPLPLQDFLME